MTSLTGSTIATVEEAFRYPKAFAEEIVIAVTRATTAHNKLDFNI